MRNYFIMALLGAMLSGNAHAYIGPGLGAGSVGVVLGIIGSIILALLAIVYYPIKRTLKRKKKKSVEVDGGGDFSGKAE